MKSTASQLPQRLTEIFLLLAGTVFILWTGVSGYSDIQHAKFQLFCLLFGGYLLLMLLLGAELMMIRGVKLPSPREIWKRTNAVQRCVLAYWAATALSTLLSPYRAEALLGMTRSEGLLTISLYCGCFLCVSVFARPKAWWSYVFGLTMTLFCALCLVQFAGQNPFGLYPEGLNFFDGEVRYSGVYLGTVGNADLAAALLSLAVPVFWVSVLRLRDKLRFALLVPLALCLLVLYRLNVQAGLLAVLVGTVLTVPAVLPVSAKCRKWLWIAAAVLAAAALLFIFAAEPSGKTLHELHELLHGRWDDRFGNGRLYIWREVLARVPEHLLFGAGPDTMAAARIPGFDRIVPQTGETLRFLVDTAHNEYLNILYHQGLLAFVPYLGALICSFVQWLRCSRSSAGAAILGGAVLYYCVQAFFGFSMCQTAGLFWLAWGVLAQTCHK